jgi:hypothetical protein
VQKTLAEGFSSEAAKGSRCSFDDLSFHINLQKGILMSIPDSLRFMLVVS